MSPSPFLCIRDFHVRWKVPMLLGFAYPLGISRCGAESTTADRTRPETTPRVASVRIEAIRNMAPPVLAASLLAASSASRIVDQKRFPNFRSNIVSDIEVYLEYITYYVLSITILVTFCTHYAGNSVSSGQIPETPVAGAGFPLQSRHTP